SSNQEAGPSHSQTPTPISTPEPEPEKMQLASSLFVGLATHSSVTLMGKSEQKAHQFRRKTKASGLSGELISNPLVCAPSSVDNLLCENLLESSITSDSAKSSPSQTSQPSGSLTTNGTCDVQLTDSYAKGDNPSLIRDNVVAEAADSAPHEDWERPKDLSSHLPVDLIGLSHSEITSLCSSQSLDVSACHVQKEDALALVVFIYNSSSSDIQNSPNAALEVRSHTAAACQYSLTVKRPSVHAEVVGTISYQLPVGTPRSVQDDRLLTVVSRVAFRPLTVSTEEYGKMWLAFSHDTKQNLKLMGEDHESLTVTLNILTEKLHLHVVEIIGIEGILACQLLQNLPCLMHCRVHAGTLAVWLRSPVADLPDCLIYHCQRALQEL
uniref:AP-4 complex subunit epsilon-1 C-terminal domain-containing protein n=1 Tax=Mola mola TaxID=94237 RepID=A0A3Q3WPF1_MOLML